MPRRNEPPSPPTRRRPRATPQRPLASEIESRLGDTGEQRIVVGPLVARLVEKGWSLDQLIFGSREWRVPARPSEATKREKGAAFTGFPCDIAVFDSPKRLGDPLHLLAIVECKIPDEDRGVSQLETYMGMEPHAKLGIWTNSSDPSAVAVFVYRLPDGSLQRQRRIVGDIPAAGDPVSPTSRRFRFGDLMVPSAETVRSVFEELLDRVVIDDPIVTRTEDQLDQLCNLFLLKLYSDKLAKLRRNDDVFFRPRESARRTAEEMRARFGQLVNLYPDTFTTERDRQLILADASITHCVEALAPLRLGDIGSSTVSLGFQVLRGAALRSGEGQYFTPQPVIAAGVKLLQVGLDDLIIDPACGTGGFLVEVYAEMQRQYPGRAADLSRWAQTNIFGIDKDAIAVKLTKAIMQIAEDGSAHCVRGDSVRTHLWPTEYPHLTGPSFANGRFSVVVTNPPFGQNLKVSASDARLSGLDIARVAGGGTYRDLEIGLLFLQRAQQLLRVGGRLGIILPETYFFSPQYQWLFDWLEPRFRPLAIADVPMEAFAGFCRAKTNFYVFEKVG
jgi:type I restriction enzyme M protein